MKIWGRLVLDILNIILIYTENVLSILDVNTLFCFFHKDINIFFNIFLIFGEDDKVGSKYQIILDN